MRIALSARALSKCYTIGRGAHAPYGTLREAVYGQLARLRPTSRRPAATDAAEFWALRDVEFEVARGERVGIVGRNGAGKSTLLKILSRITEPTIGRVEIGGRVASLLEVGTGFHPELTGRENIYLNGAILGMRRVEIRRDFDAIVAFAEIDRFLDTPVKRYSSGMYVRLAFSVAAHLSSDILLVDEVLAVGDAKFQEKCLGKIEQLTSTHERTVLFVSHNMAAVRALCTRALVIDAGRVAFDGGVNDAITAYSEGMKVVAATREWVQSSCSRVRLRVPYLLDGDGRPMHTFAFGTRIALRFELDIDQPVQGLELGFAVVDTLGQRVFTSHMFDDPRFPRTTLGTGKIVIDSDLDLPTLAPGRYRIAYGMHDGRGVTLVYSENEVEFEVVATSRVKSGANGILWHTSRWQRAAESEDKGGRSA